MQFTGEGLGHLHIEFILRIGEPFQKVVTLDLLTQFLNFLKLLILFQCPILGTSGCDS